MVKCKYQYTLELSHPTNPVRPDRVVEADHAEFVGDWLVFFRRPPTGGSVEFLRISSRFVQSMETERI